ncbi:MAG TPA: DUF308 domain-containing protein [Pedobacter sp.]
MKTQNINLTYWWLILIAGLLLFGLGIWVVVSPLNSYISISLALSIVMLVTGIAELIFAIVNFKSIETWGWIFVSGLIDLSIGGYLFLYPLITMAILPVIIGLWLLFRGFIVISNSFDMRSYGFKDWGWLMLAGILIVVLALMILSNPVFGIINIIFWTGLAFVWAGISRILLSLKLRKFKKELLSEPD